MREGETIENDEIDGQAQKSSRSHGHLQDFSPARTQWPFHTRLSSGLQNRGLLGQFSVVRRKTNAEIVRGAERYPGPHGKTPRGVESSITAADDLETPNIRF